MSDLGEAVFDAAFPAAHVEHVRHVLNRFENPVCKRGLVREQFEMLKHHADPGAQLRQVRLGIVDLDAVDRKAARLAIPIGAWLFQAPIESADILRASSHGSGALRKRSRQLAEIPEQARHDAKRLLRHGEQNVLVGRMLRAAGIGMRHPDGG
jgi:hypothetical protein